MSKKNNRKIKARAHAFDVKREKEELSKREGKKHKLSSVQDAPMTKAKKQKKVRLRKNATVRGIRIKSAEDRKRVEELLAAEQEAKEMQMEME